MPWNYRPWGCRSGRKGSCNNGWIQFEICEDSLLDEDYFNKVYLEACEITAYLCKMFNINPKGTVIHNGVTVPTILCHQDAYKLGLGSDHSDVYHWFSKYNKDMDKVRNDVAAILLGVNLYSTFDTFEKDICVKELTPNSAKLTFKLSDGIDIEKLSLHYTLTNLTLDTATVIDEKIPISNDEIEVTLNEINPNSAYLFELGIKDEFNTMTRFPGIIVNTPQDYPEAIRDIAFDLDTFILAFRQPSSWGKTPNRLKGYRISLIVNNKIVKFSDSFIEYLNTDNYIVKNISKFFDNVTLSYDDVVQIGISPWVQDSQNNKIFARFGSKCSRTSRKSCPLKPLNKVFLELKNSILYLFNK
jgi:hypothetical protein